MKIESAQRMGRGESSLGPLHPVRWAFTTLALLTLCACGDNAPPSPARGGPDPIISTQGPAVPEPSPEVAVTPTDVAPTEVAAGSIERWYEMNQGGQKLGWIRVVWAPSTWQGLPTVRDITTVSTVSVRDMLGTEEENHVETTSEVERSADGTLHWMKSVSIQDGRRSSGVETTWSRTGYAVTTTVSESSSRVEIPATEPAHVDPEAFLHDRIAQGGVRPGDHFVCRQLDVESRKVVDTSVEVVGSEPAPGPNGDVPCLKVKVTDPTTGTESWWWFDAEGAVARYRLHDTDIRRVAPDVARRKPATPHTYSISTPSSPQLERIFTAQRCLVDVHVRPDADRPLPEPPASPFSRVLAVDADPQGGHILRVECLAYDAPATARATIPVKDPEWAIDLEPTALMPIGHPIVQRAARRVVGDTTSARVAVERLADFVVTLRKMSAVGEANAIEILETHGGDCSEHATLFVALCRAVGVPARKCTGYVNIGEAWGAHAWAEVWVGAWMGVDPTTGDVGSSARYLFFGYADRRDAKAGVVSARAMGRLRFVSTRLEEGDDRVDLAGPATWTSVDEKTRRARHHLLGLEARGWPDDWEVTATGSRGLRLVTPQGVVSVTASADQGTRGKRFLASFQAESSFAGQPAAVSRTRGGTRIQASSRRRLVEVVYQPLRGGAGDFATLRPTLERVLAPSFTHVPRDP